jgi:hypothetical protein
MPGYAELLSSRLQDAAAILALVGNSEDAHFDCKEWPAREEDAQRVFAKAACGLTNAEGGVLVVGRRARATSKDEPDLVESPAPVADTKAVQSGVLDQSGNSSSPESKAYKR